MRREKSMNRRRFIGTAGAAATAAIVPNFVPAIAQTHSNRLTFDWTNPQDNLTAFVKVMGDLAGKAHWWSAQGTIYGRRPGQMTIPILRVEGVRWIRFDKIENGYSMITRDWAIFRDLKTGAVIDEYDNPFTGKKNKVDHILLSKAVAWDMTPDKGQFLPGYTGEGWLIGKPLLMPWVEEGNHVAVTLELLVKYGNGVVGSEMEHFLADRDELYDPDITGVRNARQAWVGNSPWLRWMEMKDFPGGTQWHSTGLKHDGVADLRAEFREAVNRYYPGSLEAPEEYRKPSK